MSHTSWFWRWASCELVVWDYQAGLVSATISHRKTNQKLADSRWWCCWVSLLTRTNSKILVLERILKERCCLILLPVQTFQKDTSQHTSTEQKVAAREEWALCHGNHRPPLGLLGWSETRGQWIRDVDPAWMEKDSGHQLQAFLIQ